MSNPIQNFFKATITQDWSIGTGNFYVSVKPTTSVGRLVVSPSSDTLREIVEYTSTGTDGNGDYIVISVRGVGGTTEQTHTVGEKVRMNITAEDWEDMRDDIDSIVAAGAPNASTVQKGLVEIATDAEIIAGTEIGSTGASLVVTPKILKDNFNTLASTPIVRTYKYTSVGGVDTRFDITNPSGTTFRYTYDGTGTDPVINTTTFPVGTQVNIRSLVININNNGYFVVTGSGTNYFEVTNASGVAENDKILYDGYLYKNSDLLWTKPSTLKYIKIQVQGGGSGGQGGNSDHNSNGGNSGAYAEKILKNSELGATESIAVGHNGFTRDTNTQGTAGGESSFGSHVSCTGGSSTAPSSGGVATGGDININGQVGNLGTGSTSTDQNGGKGADSMLGFGGIGGRNSDGGDAVGFGAGGGGSGDTGTSRKGGVGSPGIIIVTEYYI